MLVNCKGLAARNSRGAIRTFSTKAAAEKAAKKLNREK